MVDEYEIIATCGATHGPFTCELSTKDHPNYHETTNGFNVGIRATWPVGTPDVIWKALTGDSEHPVMPKLVEPDCPHTRTHPEYRTVPMVGRQEFGDRCIACGEILMAYYATAHDREGKQFGSFVIKAKDMPEALKKMSTHIEIVTRPDVAEMRVRFLYLAQEENQRKES